MVLQDVKSQRCIRFVLHQESEHELKLDTDRVVCFPVCDGRDVSSELTSFKLCVPEIY